MSTEKPDSDSIIKAYCQQVPEIHTLLTKYEQNPFYVIRIGRQIAQKLDENEEDFAQALDQTTNIYDTNLMDPFRPKTPGLEDLQEMSDLINIIIENDDAMQGLEGDILSTVDFQQAEDPFEFLNNLNNLKTGPFFTSGEPPRPDEVKQQQMRRLAAGILLFAGYEAARSSEESKVDAENAIDALALPISIALNSAFLARPPGEAPHVIEGAKKIMEIGRNLFKEE